MMFLPYFISWVVVSAFMYNFCNYEYGIVNTVLKFFGREPVSVYSTPSYWYFLLPFLYVWKSIGYGSVLYLAAIMGIDQECYEAAKIDGAGRMKRIIHISLPGITPTIVTLLILKIGQIMSIGFEKAYLLQNDLNLKSSEIISTLVYKQGILQGNIGYATAVGLMNSCLNLLLIILANKFCKKFFDTSLW